MNISMRNNTIMLILLSNTLISAQALPNHTALPASEVSTSSEPLSSESPAVIPADKIEHELATEKKALEADRKAALEAIEKEHITYIQEETLKLFGSLQQLLQELSSLIAHDSNFAKNRKNLNENIAQLQDALAHFSKIAFLNPDKETLGQLLTGYRAIKMHIEKAVDNGFQEFPPLDPTLFQTRKKSSEITTQDLMRAVTAHRNNLMKLKQRAENVGLKWYNHAYRAFYNKVIEPCQKYNIIKHGALGLGSLIYIAHLFETWDREEQNNPLVSKKDVPVLSTLFRPILDNMGPAARSYALGNGMAMNTTPYNDLKWFGKLENSLNSLSTGQYIIGGLILGAAYKNYAHLAAKQWQKICYRAEDLSNWLKGGAYRDKKAVDHEPEAKATFDDIVGLDYAKGVLRELIEYLKDPERFDRLGHRPDKGYLFVGPSRTGKSYLAEALCGQLKKELREAGMPSNKVRFFALSAAEINMGGISKLREYAERFAPCVLFIDEIDLLMLQRGANSQLLSDFLTTMSGFNEGDPKKPVILLGATNKPENLDFALKTGGRFSCSIPFDFPAFKDRLELLSKKISKLSLNPKSFDLARIAHETERRSYEDLDRILRYALNQAKLRGSILTQELLDEAVDHVIRKIMSNDGKHLPIHEKKIIAAHQSGRALASLLLQTPEQLVQVTIKPVVADIKDEWIYEQFTNKDAKKQQQDKTVFGKTFTASPHDTVKVRSHQDCIKMCKYQLAGYAAETILNGSCSYEYNQESRKQAFDIALSLTMKGLDAKDLSDDIRNDLQTKAHQLLEQCEKEVTQLLEQNKELLMIIGAALLEYETLTVYDVAMIIGNHLKQQEEAKKAASEKVETKSTTDTTKPATDKKKATAK